MKIMKSRKIFSPENPRHRVGRGPWEAGETRGPKNERSHMSSFSVCAFLPLLCWQRPENQGNLTQNDVFETIMPEGPRRGKSRTKVKESASHQVMPEKPTSNQEKVLIESGGPIPTQRYYSSRKSSINRSIPALRVILRGSAAPAPKNTKIHHTSGPLEGKSSTSHPR